MEFIIIISLALGSLFLACIITPCVYSLLQLYIDGMSIPYSRVFDRAFLVLFVVGLIVFRRSFSWQSIREKFSVNGWKNRFIQVFAGLFLSLLASYLLVPFLVKFDYLVYASFDYSVVMKKLPKIFLASLIISILEETIFRACMYLSLRKKLNALWAAILTSGIYSLVHFLSPDKRYVYPGYSFLEGFVYLKAVLARLLEPGVPLGMVGLFIVGLVLCLAVERSKALYISIGLHMGWVLAVKTVPMYTDISDTAVVASGIGARYFLVAQPIGWISVILVGLLVYKISVKLCKS
jgi:uncharacterized protein